MRPVRLEIVTKVMTTYGHCRACEALLEQVGLDQKHHAEDMNEYPADLKDEYLRLSEWIRELVRLYRHRLQIKVIDVQSPLGLYKSFRHRIRSYPAFIVEGKDTYAGWDRNHLESLLDKHIRSSPLPRNRKVQPSFP